MVAHQVRRGERNPGPRQQQVLDEPRRPPVAVPVRVNPRNVQVGQRRFQDALGHAAAVGILEGATDGRRGIRRGGHVGGSHVGGDSGVRRLGRSRSRHIPFGRSRPRTRHVVLVQPPAKAVQQVVAVLPRRGSIPTDPGLERRDLPWNDPLSQHLLQPIEHGPIGVGDPLSREPRVAAAPNLVADAVAGVQDVAHFPSQVLLRRRQVESAVQCPAHLLLGQRVVFDGGGRPGALDEIRPVELLGGARRQDGPRNLLAEGHGLPQQSPEPRRRPVEVDREADPGVAGLVGAWGHVCWARRVMRSVDFTYLKCPCECPVSQAPMSRVVPRHRRSRFSAPSKAGLDATVPVIDGQASWMRTSTPSSPGERNIMSATWRPVDSERDAFLRHVCGLLIASMPHEGLEEVFAHLVEAHDFTRRIGGCRHPSVRNPS